MGGICGIVDYEGTHLAVSRDRILQPIIEALRHRGPDSCGTHFAPPAVLGATRLAIIDLSERAAQPMTHPSDSLTLVLDGEIYNYLELRKDLESLGEVFRSNSDTEVVLSLYARRGPACLHLLRGKFAFAVWHRQEQRLFLARDRVGEKPLVYYYDGSVFAFASEIPALLRLDWIPRRVDVDGLHLGLYYVQAPAPWTAFRDIRRLPPGTWLEVSRKGLRSEPYWSCRFDGADPFRDLASAAEAVAGSLDETTALMCRSDVPLGATLSGGLDSGSVVASMSRTNRGFPTFRVSSGPAANPAEYRSSETIARMYGTQQHQFNPPPESLMSFEDVISVFGEPLAMPIAADAQHLARQAKPVATVVLTGTGGDELFGGYPDHWVLRRLDRQRSLRSQRASQLPPRIGERKHPREDLLALPAGGVFGALKFPCLRAFADRAYGPRMKEAAAHHDPAHLCGRVFEASGAETLMEGFLAQELMLLNQYNIISIIGADGMRHSVEFRSPFLDVKMIELAMRIPTRFKIGLSGRTLRGKLVLREAMRGRLPLQTLWAPDKTGFVGIARSDHWLHGESGSQCGRMLTSSALSDLGLFDTQALQELWLLSALCEDLPVAWLWGVATIAAWLERYF